jgi:hypothetical protein
MQLIRLKLDTYDPLHPDQSTPVILAQTTAYGVNLPASGGTIGAFDNRILSDPALRKSFRYFLIAGSGLAFEPEANDILKFSGGYARVLGATPLNPGGDGAIIHNVGATLDSNIKFEDSPEPQPQLTL